MQDGHANHDATSEDVALYVDDSLLEMQGAETETMVADGGFALLSSVMVDGGDRYAVSATAFDSREELLWMGNSGGHVTSYYGPALEKYTSFQANEQNDIRQLVTTDTGVLALSKTHLKCNTRQGISVFNYTSQSLIDLQCMLLYSPTLSPPSGTLLLGGYQQSLLLLDLYEMKELRQTPLDEPNCSIARGNEKYLFTGDISGKIAMRSWETLETIQTLDAHSGPISDFDICGTKLVTCGYSTRSIGGLTCDRFLMVYDLRMVRAVAPITVSFDPFFLRFLPAYSDNRMLVASQTGSFQVVDIGASSASPFLYHIDNQGTALLSIDVSPTKQCVAFGDGAGVLHLFSDRVEPIFNEFSRPTEFPDQTPPLPAISFCDQFTPLSMVPMPLQKPCDGRLLSDWPTHLTKHAYRVPMPIDPEVLQNMKMVNFIGYASRPHNQSFPNVVPYDLKADAMVSRSRSPQPGGSGIQQGADSGKGTADSVNSLVPSIYRKIAVRYGRYEPDYRSYNQTDHTALEVISPNSYLNPIFQVFFYMHPLQNAIRPHLCRREFCLTCEISFLFHMLQTATDSMCSASNFLRAFRAMPEASGLGLVLNDRDSGTEVGTQKGTNLASLIQGVNLFLLRQFHAELTDRKHATDGATGKITTSGTSKETEVESSSKEDCVEGAAEETNEQSESVIEAMFASSIYYITRCKCGSETSRDDKTMVLALANSSTGNNKNSLPTTPAGFASALEKGLSLEQTTQTWCEKCARFQPSVQARRTRTLPNVLLVNCPVDNEQKLPSTVQRKEIGVNVTTVEKPCRFGAKCVRADCVYKHPERCSSPELTASTQDRIPTELNLRLADDGVVTVKMGGEESVEETDWEYELYAVVDLIKEANEQHLVASVRTETDWMLFNDYCVSPITGKDASTFDLSWKCPCLLYFVKRGYNIPARDSACTCPIDDRALLTSVALVRRVSPFNFLPLQPHEIPKRGDHVALDAEFVTLNEEESELHSDGTKLTIKPSHMSVARVTVVRGSGPLEGTPFIDDYISTQEEVVNYLTKFSGIKPGDLDPSSTSKHLTTLKWTYIKLRYLIDNGVIFVGHGLANDFKVLNLAVPPNQVIDTVQLFRLPNRRMISLRYLAWYFLGVKIQSTTHDSVEDARTALKLYKKYQELNENDANTFTRILSEMYDKGRNLRWQVPDE